MQLVIVIAVLVTVSSVYLLRQFFGRTLEIDQAPMSHAPPPTERDAPAETLRAA